ncbi:MAG TPA: LLM class flavin-dependent oxidoreductase [Ktedonobacterales bacterium]|jgi:probable F420-dependent oxidoreductase|nr:LLM class flavin-dependent oxidoreductase [Ktedonobacterales bacterium]
MTRNGCSCRGLDRRTPTEFGVHLPLLAFRGQPFSLSRLVDYAEAAERLGFTTLCANDHLTFSSPWLDSVAALASILTKTRHMTLMTTVALPVVRGPVSLAKSLAALDILSGGRLIAGVGPGSSPQDYDLAGIAFEERWPRFDEAVQLLRSLLQRDTLPFQGTFYTQASTSLEPFPVQEPGVPIWIGSWGSEAGLRRIARLGDGWLASAYHVTPASFADALGRLHQSLRQAGRDPESFPHALGSLFYYLTEDRRNAEELLVEVVSPTLGRPLEILRERLLIGPAAECVEKLALLKAAGVHKVFLWPVEDEVSQLASFHEQVLPQLPL